MPNSAVIPSELHFIWLGIPLPKKYLITLLELIPIARRSGFKINLWVDHPSNYYQSVDRYMPDLELSVQSSFLQIKELAELKHEMKSHEFFLQKNTHNVIDEIKAGAFTRSQDRYSYFWQCVEREMIGAKNLAAASDLLRYAILYLKGGYYFDTDTKFEFLYGIKNFKVLKKIAIRPFLEEPPALSAEQFPLGFSSVKDRNDILAALPEHPILKTAIESALLAYNKCDELEFGDSVNNKTVMDMKRYRDPNYLNSLDDPRLNLTTMLSGPDLFNGAIEEYKKQESLIEKLDTLTADNRCSEVSFANMSIKIEAGKSDLTWLKPDKIKVKAFDDSTIPTRSRYRFFSQAEENKSNSESKQVSQQTSSSPTLRN